jgi:hypothetical protein
MGGNGSASRGLLRTEAGREFKTVGVLGEIQIIERKNLSKPAKLPEESHTPDRIYAAFRKDGKDVGAIAAYGPDHKKLYEIHTQSHYGMSPHMHIWQDGGPISVGELTAEQKALLERVRNFRY